MRLIEYEKFKQEFKNCFTSWVNGTIELPSGKKFLIKIIDGQPFVEVWTAMEDREEKINLINQPKNKAYLKNCEYEFDGITYTITGIGYDAIKAIKGNSTEEKYYRYRSSLEAEYLLEKLANIIGQMTLV